MLHYLNDFTAKEGIAIKQVWKNRLEIVLNISFSNKTDILWKFTCIGPNEINKYYLD